MNKKSSKNNTQQSSRFSNTITLAFAVMAVPSFAGVNTAGGPMPYANLAANWWQWALEVPTDSNPLLDATGEFCGVNQKGKYWFLAGTLGGDANRTCTVPTGKSIFFPVVNTFAGAFLNDPPKTKSVPYLRELNTYIAACTDLSATLDGVPVTIIHERSSPFVIHLPEDNVFGATSDDIKNLMVSPSVDEGDYVLLEPLSQGDHDIVFESIPIGDCTTQVKVTYHLTIE